MRYMSIGLNFLTISQGGSVLEISKDRDMAVYRQTGQLSNHRTYNVGHTRFLKVTGKFVYNYTIPTMNVLEIFKKLCITLSAFYTTTI